MDEAKRIINRLREKVAAIAAAHEHVKNDLLKRTAERDRALKRLEETERRAAALEERVRVLELTAGLKGSAGSTRAARNRVGLLLREVDRCIALMNR